ncbi:hypothetical protein [Sphingomicrobium sediminis]|uniref:Uncharacterized protein n=1 Tax=Sphingomicrobium sediminis TaxID=2950949 RepID=A0A9X2J4I4_9SPHN|nr:hypothetical protein [Sphingomicrobium sediminis]MCM8557247.1 hypothetical protein [Sphingomicrobium sediminis]
MNLRSLAGAGIIALAATMTTAQESPDLADQVVDVDLDHGAYVLSYEVVSYEIDDPARVADAREMFDMLSGMQEDIRICLDARYEEVAKTFEERTNDFENELGCKERVVQVSDDGHDFTEVSRCPIPYETAGSYTDLERQVVQTSRAWQATITNNQVFGDGSPTHRSVMKQSLTHVGECTGDELDLTAELEAEIAEMEKPKA